MFLELSEAFVCPRCRPAQGMIVMVERIDGRRVIEGRLGCPECELRVPIEEETVRFDRVEGTDRRADATAEEGAEAREPPPLLADAGREEAATRIAALLGAEATAGYLLTGPRLASLAPLLAERAPEAEVLALTEEEREPAPGVTWARGASAGALPLFTGRLAGAALAGPGGREAEEAVRVVRTGGRVVLLGAGSGAEAALGGLPAAVLAREAGVVVLERGEGGFEEPFARFRGGPRPRRDDA